ncbi:MAG: preprotein translocase subunit SecG [Proteobacteria bacterium]|nr:preprotein translocase subunit SecG [Pseudomonadota bacterium]
MQALLLTIELLVSVGLVVVVLLQRSEGGALGIGGGSGGGGMGGLFSPRGAADTLTRTTTILGILFFVTCIALNLFALRGRDESSFLQTTPPAATAPVKPAAPAPAPSGPSVPVRH